MKSEENPTIGLYERLRTGTKRRASQPKEASAGCIFRNPEEVSAGWLIEQSGLKGESLGGAVVSNQHANFILNRGGATADDVISLINRVRREFVSLTVSILNPR